MAVSRDLILKHGHDLQALGEALRVTVWDTADPLLRVRWAGHVA